MKERLVRGTNVASVLRVLRSQRRLRPLPELGDWEQDLLRRRIAPSTWYGLKVFDSLLQLVHRFVYDGSEAAAQTMGKTFARDGIRAEPALTVSSGDPLATLARVPLYWKEQYNFGELNVTPLPTGDGVRVRINGYPDMSATHGHAIMGYTLELAQHAGARAPTLLLEERPWMHNSVMSYTLTWLL